MSELLPCPFCGSEAAIEEYDYYDEGPDYSVSCTNNACACSGPYRFWLTREEAAKAWNTRYERTCAGCVMIPSFTKPTMLDDCQEFCCSACGEYMVLQQFPGCLDDMPNFCPNCGAKVLSKISYPVCRDASKISDSEALHDVMVSKVAYSSSYVTGRKVMEDDER